LGKILGGGKGHKKREKEHKAWIKEFWGAWGDGAGSKSGEKKGPEAFALQ